MESSSSTSNEFVSLIERNRLRFFGYSNKEIDMLVKVREMTPDTHHPYLVKFHDPHDDSWKSYIAVEEIKK